MSIITIDYYNFDTETGTISSYYGNGGYVIIPSQISYQGANYDVKVIGDNTFFNRRDIIGIEIPNTITSIGVRAFMLCSGIIEFVVPDSVETIGNSAFANCTSLESISIGKSVTAIEYSTFANCTALKNFKFTDSILSIGNNAFRECKLLETIDIGTSVINIGERTFYRCSNLKNVNIPETIKTVGDGIFDECPLLTKITVDYKIPLIDIDTWINQFNNIYKMIGSPSTVKDRFCTNNIYTINVDYPEKINARLIGDNVIYINQGSTFVDPGVDTSSVKYQPVKVITSGEVDTSALGDYKLSYTVVDAYNNSSNNLSRIVTVRYEWFTFDKDTGTISNYTGSQTTVEIPFFIDGYEVKVIGRDTFKNNTTLVTIIFPYTINISEGAFEGCKELKKFIINMDNTLLIVNSWAKNFNRLFAQINPVMYNSTWYCRKNLIDVKTDCLFPASGSSAQNGIFLMAIGYLEVEGTVIPQILYNYTDIDGIGPLMIPDSISKLVMRGNDCTFDIPVINIVYQYVKNNTNLTSLIIGKYISGIGYEAFFGCTGIKGELVIPFSVKSIQKRAFYGCVGLESLSILNPEIIIEAAVFYGCSGLNSISLPAGLKTIATETFAQCSGLENIIIPDTVETIEYYAFYKCSGLKNLVIPDSVKTLGESVFNDCREIISLSIGKSVNIIGRQAFMGCKGLLNVIIPDSVISIGDGAFADCTNLEYLTLSNSLKIIDYNTFYGCSSLKSCIIPDLVTEIGDNAFDKCTGVKSVSIGNYVTIIGYDAFMDCKELVEIEIPVSVTTIKDYAFANCEKLKRVSIGYLINNIGKDVFLGCNSLIKLTIDYGTTVMDIQKWIAGFSNIYSMIGSPSTITEKFCKNNVHTINVYYPNSVTAELIGPNHMYINQGTTFVDPGVETYFVKYKPATVTIIGEVNTSKTGTYILNYIVTDSYNNSLILSRDVTVQYQGFTFDSFTGTISNYTGPGEFVIIPSTIDGYKVKVIAEDTCKNKKSIIDITIPDSIISIGTNAFQGCTGLIDNLIISNSVITIGSYAFGGCTAIKNLTIGHSVITIGDQAFYGCSALSSVIIPASIENIINKSAFLNCNSLVRVTVDFDNTDINIDYWINRFNTIYMTMSSPSTVTEKFCKNNIYTINVDYPDKVNATLIGGSNISVNQGTTFVDPGVNTSNVKYQPVTVTSTGTVNTSKLGRYLLTYTVTDAHNNAQILTRTVHVVA